MDFAEEFEMGKVFPVQSFQIWIIVTHPGRFSSSPSDLISLIQKDLRVGRTIALFYAHSPGTTPDPIGQWSVTQPQEVSCYEADFPNPNCWNARDMYSHRAKLCVGAGRRIGTITDVGANQQVRRASLWQRISVHLSVC